MYCFLIGVVFLALGYVCSYLLNDERIRLRRPTLLGTLANSRSFPPAGLNSPFP